MEKSKKSYHHGNLREELIEKGIEMINEAGEEKLSLRKVAKMCGVSNAAPYTYFKITSLYKLILLSPLFFLPSFQNTLYHL